MVETWLPDWVGAACSETHSVSATISHTFGLNLSLENGPNPASSRLETSVKTSTSHHTFWICIPPMVISWPASATASTQSLLLDHVPDESDGLEARSGCWLHRKRHHPSILGFSHFLSADVHLGTHCSPFLTSLPPCHSFLDCVRQPKFVFWGRQNPFVLRSLASIAMPAFRSFYSLSALAACLAQVRWSS